MMRRKPRHDDSHSHERWLVSYADFITLLFAFFVVMYSVSSVNEGKYKVLSETLEGVFNATQKSMNPIQVGQQTSSPPKSESPIVQPFESQDKQPVGGSGNLDAEGALKQMADRFSSSLKKLIGDGLVSVNANDEWIELSLRNNLLFSSGDAVPVDPAFPLLDSIAAILKDYPNAILVEGFTDNVPIRSPVYPSNWELSAARSSAVVRLLAFGGVDPKRMAAVGYGEFQPIARNDTAEGRQRNRRVVLLIARDEKVRLTVRR
ncbi:flagellar motor protein MotD [Hahella sp. CCB-MM4]|uniref:flagellar motor protein MotD n=1 Tax=Hahella sp. (strain CCB-MM4) TaxID=1926491 RepID=UPI000B9B2407|nr:flagellar motor protein MotD [Hahella sp. CCB-MM4]OZG72866.1 flagellar motor protein MotD [Hahella sp. CCB-MM4]